MNPDDYVITRKRKLYKFALFANSPICFELEEWDQVWPVDVVEIGAGTGLFSLALATAHPDQHFLAVDVKADRLQTGARAATELGLNNIRFLRARADQLADIMPAHQLLAIWLTFVDPFPKPRSAKHRLTHPHYLALYQKLLCADGRLYLKHDNLAFSAWSLEQLVASRWTLNELSFDLHGSNLDDEYKIMTTYEQRWTNEGRLTHFVSATPPRA